MRSWIMRSRRDRRARRAAGRPTRGVGRRAAPRSGSVSGRAGVCCRVCPRPAPLRAAGTGRSRSWTHPAPADPAAGGDRCRHGPRLGPGSAQVPADVGCAARRRFAGGRGRAGARRVPLRCGSLPPAAQVTGFVGAGPVACAPPRRARAGEGARRGAPAGSSDASAGVAFERPDFARPVAGRAHPPVGPDSPRRPTPRRRSRRRRASRRLRLARSNPLGRGRGRDAGWARPAPGPDPHRAHAGAGARAVAEGARRRISRLIDPWCRPGHRRRSRAGRRDGGVAAAGTVLAVRARPRAPCPRRRRRACRSRRHRRRRVGSRSATASGRLRPRARRPPGTAQGRPRRERPASRAGRRRPARRLAREPSRRRRPRAWPQHRRRLGRRADQPGSVPTAGVRGTRPGAAVGGVRPTSFCCARTGDPASGRRRRAAGWSACAPIYRGVHAASLTLARSCCARRPRWIRRDWSARTSRRRTWPLTDQWR